MDSCEMLGKRIGAVGARERFKVMSSPLPNVAERAKLAGVVAAPVALSHELTAERAAQSLRRRVFRG